MTPVLSRRFPRLSRYGTHVAVLLALGLLYIGSTGKATIEAAQMGAQHQLQEATMGPATQIDIEFLAQPPTPTPQQQQMMQYTETNRHETPPLPAGAVMARQMDSGTYGPELILPGVSSEGGAVAPPSPASAPNTHRQFVNEFYKGPTGYNSDVGEPSIDANNNVFFISHNWYAAVSTDFGDSWSYVNPFTIGNADGGFCCDQKVIYAPDHDMLIWLIQTIKDTVDNRYRVVVFRGLSDAATATYYYYDLLPSAMGATGDWLDFPDVQVGNNYFYLLFNRFTVAGSSYNGSSFVRFPLADMADAGSFFFQYWNAAGTASNRLTAGATDTIYWLGHVNTSTVRIYSLSESSTSVGQTDVALSQTWSNPVACPGPGGVNPCSRIQGGWNGRPTAAFIGGLNRNEIVMMWTMGPYGPATRNHVMSARFSMAPHTLVGMAANWSNSVDITYPSAAPNARGAVGGTYLAFFPTIHPVCYTWITDDITPSLHNPALQIGATSTAIEPSSGDYLETRGYGDVWVGACFSYSGGHQNSTDYRAIMFGRSRDAPAFVKGMTADGLLPPPSTLVSRLADAEGR